jgi:regulator of protease activity HflC (stomatin/prohibitin superfamily)
MALIGTVPQAHALVITRFGKFARVVKSGLYIKMPWEASHKPMGWNGDAIKEDQFIELSEQATNTDPRGCHTKDNVTVKADAIVYWRIVDVRRACFEVDVLPSSVKDIALNALRSNIGKLSLDQVLSERETLSDGIAAELSATAKKWGIQFTRVELQELSTSDGTAKAMQAEMEAERQSRAIIATAKGNAAGELIEAEAHAKALQITAEGEALAMARTAEAESFYLEKLKTQVGDKEAAQIVIAQKFLSGFETISQSPANKVFLPSSFKGILSLGEDASA